jgi:hypothetical protein
LADSFSPAPHPFVSGGTPQKTTPSRKSCGDWRKESEKIKERYGIERDDEKNEISSTEKGLVELV